MHTNSWNRAYYLGYRRVKVRWVTPLGPLTGSTVNRRSIPSSPSQRRNAASQHDGDDDDMEMIDQICGQKLADG